ncbi:hypothetical protein LB555_04025 [Mesorhizobium sp. BR-1-1-10]|nr:hypothetical protein [Mesorhizobium sp. BR-1-1-10]
MGVLQSTTEFASFSANLVYALYHDGDLIVFTDDFHVIRINGTTAATVWTKTVPYQITASLVNQFTPPDLNRLDGTYMFREPDAYNFTDLDTGLTTSIATSGSVGKVIYDDQSNLSVTTSQFIAQPLRTLFNASADGDLRRLDALLSDLFVHGGGYDPDQILTINIDDMIQGAVFDVTAGVRDVARSIADPYSFAIFERAGQIVCKRAFSDVIDAVISSAGDIADMP